MGRIRHGTLMESSFISRAKSAIHNAATKAERLLSEIKEDIKIEFSRSALPDVDSDEITNNALESDDYVTKKQFRDRLSDCLLTIFKDPEKFVFFCCEEVSADDISVKAQLSRDLCEENKELQNLKFEYVPEKMSEHEFSKHLFLEFVRMKRDGGLHNWEDKKISLHKCKDEIKSPKMDPIEEDAYEKAKLRVVVPSSKILRRLFAVIEAVRSTDRMKDLEMLKTDKEFSQTSALVSGFAAMRNSLLRENKDAKSSNNQVHAYVSSLFDSGTVQAWPKSLPEEIKGAPPGCFVSYLAEIMGGISACHQMAKFWSSVIAELRRHWELGEPIPRLPVDANPDLRYCLVLQKVQVINACIARRKRNIADLGFLNAVYECMEKQAPQNIGDIESFISLLRSKGLQQTAEELEPSRWFAQLRTGEFLMRIGANYPTQGITMLETGQQVYCPVTQEGAVLTEDLIEETQEFVLRTGSMGLGCSQLLSDMQAFKAANPGCILEDFVRWYSPLDWRQYPESGTLDENCRQKSRGCLSARMQSQGNLWQELWSSAKAIPAAKQAPLFDEDLAVESALDALEEIKPLDLFEQLFKVILGTGFAIAENWLMHRNDLLSSKYRGCKDFVASTCHNRMDTEDLEQLCQAYEMMEIMLQQSSDELHYARSFNSFQDNEVTGKTTLIEESRCLHYSSILDDVNLSKSYLAEKLTSNNGKSDSGFNVFARIFEVKFTRKSSQDLVTEVQRRTENEWTLL